MRQINLNVHAKNIADCMLLSLYSERRRIYNLRVSLVRNPKIKIQVIIKTVKKAQIDRYGLLKM